MNAAILGFMDFNIWGLFALVIGVGLCWGSILWAAVRKD
jgi:hypothetical protein